MTLPSPPTPLFRKHHGVDSRALPLTRSTDSRVSEAGGGAEAEREAGESEGEAAAGGAATPPDPGAALHRRPLRLLGVLVSLPRGAGGRGLLDHGLPQHPVTLTFQGESTC